VNRLPWFSKKKVSAERIEAAPVDIPDLPRVITGTGTGRARLLEPSSGVVTAGSAVRLVFEYVVSEPVAEGSHICLCFYHVCLWSAAQTHDPAAPGYVEATAPAPLEVKAWGDPDSGFKYKLTQFPWQHVIRITVGEGGLAAGERIVITYGAGEALATAQPFAAIPYNFRVVVVSPGAAPTPAEEHPVLQVVGGEAARLILVTPSDHSGASGRVLARIEDVSGNLASNYCGSIHVSAGPDGEEASHEFRPGDPPVHLFEDVPLGELGTGRFKGRTDSGLEAISNPFRRLEGDASTRTLWGEIHGHSNVSDGYGTPEDYFVYARDVAGLDVACLTDHDFMLSDADWRRIKRASNAANETGRFVTLQAYEWSGQNDVGGDRNLYFRGDDPPIRRCRTLHDPDNPFVYHGRQCQANHVEDLYIWLDEEVGPDDVVMIPHFGGRCANPRFHNPRYEHAVEIFSEHRRIEGLVDQFRAKGSRLGVVGGGDDHIGRPGNGFLLPGPFDGALGLLALKTGLSRPEVFDALRGRRTYATSGARIIVDFEVSGTEIGGEAVIDESPSIACKVVGTANLAKVQVFRDGAVVYQVAGSNLSDEFEDEWVDEEFDPAAKDQSYWLRVTQMDGHVAVTSPIWVVAGAA
jgi:hypothetical protein